ncbi:MAG: MoaD/ThiS family protein [Deinococcus sp.]|nr:MoaD/ThiS family protein [Deinococcus sp.]
MRVRVLLFALYREQAGVRELLLDLAEGASVHSAQAALMARYPALSLHGGLAAVNQKFAQGGETLKEGDEVAFLPPVSGGGDAAKDNSYGLTEEKLDLEAYLSWASAPPYGAVVSFLGTTRSPNKGSDIAYLDYEAYSGMAEQVMGQITLARCASATFWVGSRYGTVPAGSTPPRPQLPLWSPRPTGRKPSKRRATQLSG